jgi:hypothetical protein
MRIAFALLSIIVGLSLAFGGYRLARFIIPFMGFMAGLSLGGAVMADLSGEVFLGTFLGVVVGLTAGLILAVLAYFYYVLAVVILAGSIGYLAGSGLILLLGFSPGVLSVATGIIIGLLIGFAALMVNAPKYVLIILTTVAGAILAVGGVMLLFNQVPLDFFSYTTAKVAIANSFLWSMVALIVFGIGMISQINTSKGYLLEEWAMTNDPTHHHHPPTVTHSGSGVH